MSGVAVVTGAAGGIGSATVRQLTADGMTVVALDLYADAASAVSPQSYALDVSNADAVDDVMGRILAQFGRIDVLVNNAGITGSQEATTAHATPVDEFDKVMAVSQKIGKAVCAAFGADRAGMIIAGLEVPHCHIHLVPIQSEADLGFANADHHASAESLDDAARRIRETLGTDEVDRQLA